MIKLLEPLLVGVVALFFLAGFSVPTTENETEILQVANPQLSSPPRGDTRR